MSHALHKGAVTHLKEQKRFQLCSSMDCWKLVRLWRTHSKTFLCANPGGCLNFGDETLGKQHHKNSTKPPPFPRLVLHGQMIKTASNELCTFTHRGRMMTDKTGTRLRLRRPGWETSALTPAPPLNCCRTWETQFASVFLPIHSINSWGWWLALHLNCTIGTQFRPVSATAVEITRK